MTERTRRILLVVALAVVSAAAIRPLRADFNGMVRAIESRYGVRQTWIPFMGFARFAVQVAHPDGVSDFQLATFEHARIEDSRGLEEIIEKNAAGFQPVVRARSGRNGECSFIYARPAGRDRVALLIFAHDNEDTTLLSVVVSLEEFSRAMEHPDHMAENLP
jgi:hypothetical protein